MTQAGEFETLEQFAARQSEGGKPIKYVRVGDIVYFENGASWQDRSGHIIANRSEFLRAKRAEEIAQQRDAQRVKFDMFVRRQVVTNEDGVSSLCQHIQAPNRTYLFENGAAWSDDWNWHDPPQYRLHLLQAKLAYVTQAMDIEARAWHTYRNECLDLISMASRYPNANHPPCDWEDQLDNGSRRYAKLAAAKVKLDAEIEAMRPPEEVERERRRRQLEAERREKVQGMQTGLVSKSLDIGPTTY